MVDNKMRIYNLLVDSIGVKKWFWLDISDV